jgi:hypothetical protein
LNASDLVDWKRHPITQAVFSTLAARVNDLAERLIDQAGKDPIQDATYAGAIKAHRDMLNIDFSEIEQETE